MGSPPLTRNLCWAPRVPQAVAQTAGGTACPSRGAGSRQRPGRPGACPCKKPGRWPAPASPCDSQNETAPHCQHQTGPPLTSTTSSLDWNSDTRTFSQSDTRVSEMHILPEMTWWTLSGRCLWRASRRDLTMLKDGWRMLMVRLLADWTRSVRTCRVMSVGETSTQGDGCAAWERADCGKTRYRAEGAVFSRGCRALTMGIVKLSCS